MDQIDKMAQNQWHHFYYLYYSTKLYYRICRLKVPVCISNTIIRFIQPSVHCCKATADFLLKGKWPIFLNPQAFIFFWSLSSHFRRRLSSQEGKSLSDRNLFSCYLPLEHPFLTRRVVSHLYFLPSWPGENISKQLSTLVMLPCALHYDR